MNHEQLEKRDKREDGIQARELAFKFIKKKQTGEVGVWRENGEWVISRASFTQRVLGTW